MLTIPITTTLGVDKYDLARECNDSVDSIMKTRGSKAFNLSNPIDEASFKYMNVCTIEMAKLDISRTGNNLTGGYCDLANDYLVKRRQIQ
jgi:glutaminase